MHEQRSSYHNGLRVNVMVLRAKHNNTCFVICLNDFSIYTYIYIFLGSIKIFGGLICAQRFYNLLKTDVFSPSSVIKSEAMMDAGMPRVL